MPLATAMKSPTPVADKNLAASKPTDTPTGPHKAMMVTPTYTVVLLQVAVMVEPRAKPANLGHCLIDDLFDEPLRNTFLWNDLHDFDHLSLNLRQWKIDDSCNNAL